MEILDKSLKGFNSLLTDENGSISSKRFVGLLTSTSLCFTMFCNSFMSNSTGPSDNLVNAVALLAFGSLGLSSVDKFTKMKHKILESIKSSDKK